MLLNYFVNCDYHFHFCSENVCNRKTINVEAAAKFAKKFATDRPYNGVAIFRC